MRKMVRAMVVSHYIRRYVQRKTLDAFKALAENPEVG